NRDPFCELAGYLNPRLSRSERQWITACAAMTVRRGDLRNAPSRPWHGRTARKYQATSRRPGVNRDPFYELAGYLNSRLSCSERQWITACAAMTVRRGDLR